MGKFIPRRGFEHELSIVLSSLDPLTTFGPGRCRHQHKQWRLLLEPVRGRIHYTGIDKTGNLFESWAKYGLLPSDMDAARHKASFYNTCQPEILGCRVIPGSRQGYVLKDAPRMRWVCSPASTGGALFGSCHPLSNRLGGVLLIISNTSCTRENNTGLD